METMRRHTYRRLPCLAGLAAAAVMGASPFGRWPGVLKAQAIDPREITFTFHYY